MAKIELKKYAQYYFFYRHLAPMVSKCFQYILIQYIGIIIVFVSVHLTSFT